MLPAQPKNAMSPSRTPLTKRARPWRVRPHDRPSSADGLDIVLRANTAEPSAAIAYPG